MCDKPNWTLRKLEERELDALYTRRIAQDFPSAERPSLAALHRHVGEGLQDIWIMHDGPEDAAYAVCAQARGLALVTLLAVYSEKRGGGRGTALLNLIREQYRDSRAVLLEVEDPEDTRDEAERTIRRRRIAFYERGGYHLLGDVRHSSFGVPLRLMALPLRDTLENVRAGVVADVQAIYHHILPEDKWARVTTREA